MKSLSPQHRDMMAVIALVIIICMAFPLIGSLAGSRVSLPSTRTPTLAPTPPLLPTPTLAPTPTLVPTPTEEPTPASYLRFTIFDLSCMTEPAQNFHRLQNKTPSVISHLGVFSCLIHPI